MRGRKVKKITLFLLLLSSCTSKPLMYKAINSETELVKAKNAILMIVDGQSVDISNITRWYLGKPLIADQLESGRVLTHNADTPIADSAPAATAMATGYKSKAPFVGVLPDEAILPYAKMNGEARRPIANIIEAARLAGKSVGVISTYETIHATPAAFTAHYPDRKAYDDLSEQQLYQNLDVLFGGGYKFFTPAERKDGKDLVAEFKRLGYQIVRTKEEMNKVTSGKVWGAFAEGEMAYDIDRQAVFPEQPSLQEMVAKAIEILSKNKNGFVLMVEGSKVDAAAHFNDPIGMISDSIAYDDAMRVAWEFAKKDDNTTLLSTSDHGTGGFRMDGDVDGGYEFIPLDNFLAPLKKATRTGDYIAGLIASGSNATAMLAQYYGVTDPTPAELATLTGTYYETKIEIGTIITKRAKVSYTTHGHTGEEMALYSYLPGNKRLSAGVIDNTDYANYAAASLGLNLDKTSQRLFMSVPELQDKVAGISVDANDRTLTLTKGNTSLTLTRNKNIVVLNGKEQILEGVVVYNGENWYFPSEVAKLF